MAGLLAESVGGSVAQQPPSCCVSPWAVCVGQQCIQAQADRIRPHDDVQHGVNGDVTQHSTLQDTTSTHDMVSAHKVVTCMVFSDS